MKLKEMVDILEGYGEAIHSGLLKKVLKETGISLDDVAHCVHFESDHYCRNLLYAGSNFEIFVICWKDGQCSPVHDHAGSCCGVKILDGIATENMFLKDKESICPTITLTYCKGDVIVNEDTEIHKVSNLQGNGNNLISLHIYSPPLKSNNY